MTVDYANDQIHIVASERIYRDDALEVVESIGTIENELDVIEVDCSSLEFISASALSFLLSLRKHLKQDGRASFTNVNSQVRQILYSNGFQAMYEIVEKPEDWEDSQTLEFVSDVNTRSYDFANHPYDELDMSLKDFLQAKQESADSVFLVADREYTWRDVEIASQIIACELYEKYGVRQYSHVGLAGANSVNWVFTYFAIQKLGALAVLINSNLRPAEIADLGVVADIDVICLGDMPEMENFDEFVQEIKEEPGNYIASFYDVRSSVDFLEEIGQYESVRDKYRYKVEPDSACTLIFSSGTTAKPKGVMIAGKQLLNASRASAITNNMTKDDISCLFLPMFHIFGLIVGILVNAIVGARIVLLKNARTSTILKSITENKCTVFHSVPTVMLALVNNKDYDSYDVSSVRSSIIAGAAVSPSQMQLLKDKMPNNHFASSYGLSEMSPATITAYDDTDENVINTIGHPLDICQIKIVDQFDGSDCRNGKFGEILIKSDYKFISYYKLPIEYQAIDKAGWFHTGDLGFMDDNGYVHFVGRIKELIIRSGECIAPNEIANVIASSPMIGDVKVIGVPHFFYGEEVVCCFTGAADTEFDEEAIRAFLKKRIAKYKIPYYFLQYEKFPMLANGKINMLDLKQDAIKRVEKLRQEENKL